MSNESFSHDQQAFIQSAMAKSLTKILEASNSAQDQPVQVGPNPDMIFGYSLFGLAQTHMPSSPVTDTVVRYPSLPSRQAKKLAVSSEAAATF
jgi:hypothetical protein